MSDPTKPGEPPIGSPFPNGSSPPPAGSPFPSGPPQNQTPYAQNQYAPLPADLNVRTNQGWSWNPLIGITYNGFPVGIVIVVIVGLLVLAGK